VYAVDGTYFGGPQYLILISNSIFRMVVHFVVIKFGQS